MRLAACALALLAPFAPLAAAAVDPPPPVKVMALGDSLTVGVGSTRGGGYRAPFWERMRDAGIEVDMVGGKTDGPGTFDNRHQGYAQMPLHDLSAGAFDKVRTYQPDFVLLLAGSDEVGTSHFSPHAFAANLDVMIDRIFTAKSDVKILIGTLPPAKYGKNQGAKRAVNELLRRTVRERAARGQAVLSRRRVRRRSIPQREMADAAHPNDAGYERIGEAFADASAAAARRGEDRVTPWVAVAAALSARPASRSARSARTRCARGLPPDLLAAWQTGVLYHLLHSVALLALGLYARRRGRYRRAARPRSSPPASCSSRARSTCSPASAAALGRTDHADRRALSHRRLARTLRAARS